jgi:hypothetical protein
MLSAYVLLNRVIDCHYILYGGYATRTTIIRYSLLLHLSVCLLFYIFNHFSDYCLLQGQKYAYLRSLLSVRSSSLTLETVDLFLRNFY